MKYLITILLALAFHTSGDKEAKPLPKIEKIEIVAFKRHTTITKMDAINKRRIKNWNLC